MTSPVDVDSKRPDDNEPTSNLDPKIVLTHSKSVTQQQPIPRKLTGLEAKAVVTWTLVKHKQTSINFALYFMSEASDKWCMH